MKRIWQTLAAVAMAIVPLAGSAQAVDYPNKPIKMIVAYPPGGPNDILARLFGHKLGELLKQPVVIDNRAGAGTAIASRLAARSAPDGYTLYMGSLASHGTAPFLLKEPGYDPVKDFSPISLLAVAPVVLIVPNDSPAKSAEEFLSLAKKSPGRFRYASAGIGSPPHLSAEIYKARTGADIGHVPYKGVQNILDLEAGRVEAQFDSTAATIPLITAGRVRALAIAAARRSPALPSVPTFAESGLPGFEMKSWYGILAPAGTPAEIIKTLNAALIKVAAMPDVQARLLGLGIEPQGSSPQEFAAMIDSELAKFRKVIETAGIKAE